MVFTNGIYSNVFRIENFMNGIASILWFVHQIKNVSLAYTTNTHHVFLGLELLQIKRLRGREILRFDIFCDRFPQMDVLIIPPSSVYNGSSCHTLLSWTKKEYFMSLFCRKTMMSVRTRVYVSKMRPLADFQPMWPACNSRRPGAIKSWRWN